MGRRMAIWYAGTAAALLLTATTALYATIAASLDAEGDESVDLAHVLMADDAARRGPAKAETTEADMTHATDPEPQPPGAADHTGPTPG